MFSIKTIWVSTMASDGEISCTNDPNFAVIYSFLKVFGKLYGLEIPSIAKLQQLLENTEEGELLWRECCRNINKQCWEWCLCSVWCAERAAPAAVATRAQVRAERPLGALPHQVLPPEGPPSGGLGDRTLLVQKSQHRSQAKNFKGTSTSIN